MGVASKNSFMIGMSHVSRAHLWNLAASALEMDPSGARSAELASYYVSCQ